MLNFSGSFFSFEQQNSTEENNLKNAGLAKFFSMYAMENELVLNETKEETILKIAKKIYDKKLKKNLE